jgi:hypothetical protein
MFSAMPAKDVERRRATWRAWYARNRKKAIAAVRPHRERRKRALAAWFVELKRQLVCARCGEAHPACLVFHHRDPKQKEVAIAVAMRRAWGRKRIVAELAKCEVLCANCHAKHHAKERRDGVDA